MPVPNNHESKYLRTRSCLILAPSLPESHNRNKIKWFHKTISENTFSKSIQNSQIEKNPAYLYLHSRFQIFIIHVLLMMEKLKTIVTLTPPSNYQICYINYTIKFLILTPPSNCYINSTIKLSNLLHQLHYESLQTPDIRKHPSDPRPTIEY